MGEACTTFGPARAANFGSLQLTCAAMLTLLRCDRNPTIGRSDHPCSSHRQTN
jgi:hypothetical protein